MADFIVVGSDGVAIRLAEELAALGEGVVMLARTRVEPRFGARLVTSGVRVLEGDARDVDDLRTAGLDEAPAIAIVAENDVDNIHAALAAHSARPELRLVVRMFHQALGQKLMALLPDAQVVSAATVAAPAFLNAALLTAQEIEIGHGYVEVRELTQDDDLAATSPIALFDPQARTRGLFPAARPGVLALVPGRTEAQADAGSVARRQPASFVESTMTLVRALARLVDHRLVTLLALIALLMVATAIVWSATTKYGLLDSAYFAVTTMSTTGYGDITPLTESAGHKLGTMALMLIGALSLAVIYAVITDTIIGARLTRSLEERPHPRRDHVVVVGLGRIGQRVIEGLVQREIKCIGVERDESAHGVQAARRSGVPVVLADATAPGALDALRVEDARCLMVLTDDDAANLLQAVSARARNDDLHVVLRLFEHDLAEREETAFEIQARSVSSLAAPAFAAALTGRMPLATVPVGTQTVTIVDFSAQGDGTVSDLEEAAGGEARVIALGSEWHPAREKRVKSGDAIIAVGTPSGLAAVARAHP